MSQIIGDAAIRHMAKQLAGEFYDMKRSGRFRSMDAMTRAKTLVRDPETKRIYETTVVVPFRQAYPDAHSFAVAHWPMFVDAAKQCMYAMLAGASPNITESDKEYIYSALLDDKRKRDQHPEGGVLLQQRVVKPFDSGEEQLRNAFR